MIAICSSCVTSGSVSGSQLGWSVQDRVLKTCMYLILGTDDDLNLLMEDRVSYGSVFVADAFVKCISAVSLWRILDM